MSLRKIYLIVYRSPLFPAHWSIWVPSLSNTDIGKRIQVTGDSAQGFEHEFVRNYNATGTKRQRSLFLLAEVDDKHVVDVPGDGTESIDTSAADDIERSALSIPAPGKSLRVTGSSLKTKIEIQNCQTWLTSLVEKLVAESIFPGSALDAIVNAPKN